MRTDDEQRKANDDPVRWGRIQELFAALEAIPEADHEDYLARACPDDPDLRGEVLSLLAAEPDASAYLDGLAKDLAPELTDSPDLSGRQVGAYRLLRPLGSGGMGVVYEAERTDGAFEQRVALKLLTTALAGTEARSRFLAERRILAGLEHVAIARIADGGVTEDGTPWFAMEYVEGEAIDAYCDRRRLAIRERLELFLQVCDAVEHAHRRLVVHRDLKPANVLVTDDTQVKLLDFGIAKLLEPEGAAPLTRTALRLMTPEYASPEQVRGEPVTTASDVYQLGLLLYELLTGHRPYALSHRGARELGHVICEQAPTRLSAAVSREDTLKPASGVATASVEEACQARRSSPAQLRRRLRGDLDNIVLKSLSKEPERRYGSADRLAQDVRRHLDGLPVTARADTWTYRGRKFLQRHALGASAGAGALVLVAGMAGFHTTRIQRERDRAQTEAAKAQQMSQFLTGLLRSADPREARGAELTARELLDRGVEQVDRELAAQPELQAEMLHVLGRTYLELGFYDSAERLLMRTLELRRHRLGAKHPDVAKTLSDLGLLRYQQGAYKSAQGLLEEVSRMLAASPGEDTSELVDVLRRRGQVYRSLGEYQRSRAALERALAIQSRAPGRDFGPTALILSSLAALHLETGALERAAELYERTLAIHERELGADHPAVGSALMNLAIARLEQGKLADLEAMARRNLAIQQKAYGRRHPKVGTALNNLGHFLIILGRNDEAVEVLQRALAVQSAAVGRDHPNVASTLASLGDAHLAGGRLGEARHSYRRCVLVREKALGVRQFDPLLVHSLVRLGRIEAELGNTTTAERNLNGALMIWRHAPASTDPRLVPTLVDLGGVLTEQQRCTEAVPLLQRALRVERARRGRVSSRFAEIESLLARCPAAWLSAVAPQRRIYRGGWTYGP